MSTPYCNKFWVENPLTLLCSVVIIPMNNMSLVEQMNTFTRLIIIIFVLLLLFGFKYAIIFLIISLLFIIILYYIQKKKMEAYIKQTPNYNGSTIGSRKSGLHNNIKENYNYYNGVNNSKKGKNYDYKLQPYNLKNLTTSTIRNGIVNTEIKEPVTNYFCNSVKDIGQNSNNPNYMSINQRLAGPANPKTFITPIVTPQPTAFDYWKANNLTIPSAINDQAQDDLYLSGYAVSECCGNVRGKIFTPDSQMNPQINTVIEGFNSPTLATAHSVIPTLPVREDFHSPTPATSRAVIPTLPVTDYLPSVPKPGTTTREGFGEYGQHTGGLQGNIYNDMMGGQKKENYNFPYLKTDDESYGIVTENQSGWVNTACGYNPEQVFTSNLPSNYEAGNCEKAPQMSNYNKNLYTQTIQPGVYTRNQINEPINSNIGISFQQQFEPVTCKRDEHGLTYTEHDPRIIEPAIEQPNIAIIDQLDAANVYDPRLSGYGTSYRAYTDTRLGQTKFMYDDVNAIRMPNYIVRSNIDNQPFADHYGPISSDEGMGNSLHSVMRPLANDAFLRSSLQQRDDLMERLLRKRNSELHQLRSKPHGARQYMAGSRRIF
jgi:hypothetical protein